MSARTTGLGVALMALGIVVTALADSWGTVTSWIPVGIGLIFLLLGVIASVREDLRHHIMHAAAALSLIAIIASLGSLFSRWSDSSGWAKISQIGTVLLCAMFLAAAVQSFKAARAARKAAGNEALG